MRLLRVCAAVGLVLLSGLSTSCSMFEAEPPPEEWLEATLTHAPPRRDLLRECQWAMRSAGYPPGEIDEALGTAESGWLLAMHPFSGKGRRYKGIVEATRDEETQERMVRVRVIVERNAEKKHPLEPSSAKWEPMGDDVSRAEVLREHVLMQLRQKRSES